jgi:hypothetical protein
MRRPSDRVLWSWAKQAALAIVIAAALYALSRWAGGLEIAFALWLVVVAAVVVGRLLVRALVPRRQGEVPIREDAEAKMLGQLPDRPFTGARRWEERLELARGDAAYFGRAVLPELTALVEERLRLTGELDRMRDVLGEQAATFLTTPNPKRVPSPAELSAVVTKLEEEWKRNRPASRS